MINVNVQLDFYFQLMRALDDAISTARGNPGLWSEHIETAFESIYSRLEATNFASVQGIGITDKSEDPADDELRLFRLGLMFGNWVALRKGVRFTQCIAEDEKN